MDVPMSVPGRSLSIVLDSESALPVSVTYTIGKYVFAGFNNVGIRLD
jgi:hypothetical protein